MMDFKTWLKAERGRLVETASQLGVTPGAVSQWANGQVPAERLFKLSEITGLPLEALRPDLIGKGAAA